MNSFIVLNVNNNGDHGDGDNECKQITDTWPAVLTQSSPPMLLLTAVVKIMCDDRLTLWRHVAVSTSHR